MRALRRTACALFFVLGSATIASTGATQTASEHAAEAEALFRDGRTLIKAGRTSEACAKFAESNRLDPQTGALLNLALCHEEEGKMASAWAEFNEVAERSGPTSERTGFAQRHALAAEGKLSKLRIRVVRAVPGLSLTLDGRPLRPAELGLLIPLDPGAHTVEATAPGKRHVLEQIEIATGPATRELVVNLVDAPGATAARPAPALPSLPAARSQGGAPTDPASTDTSRRNVGLIVGSIGLVGIGVAGVYGVRALQQKKTYDDLCHDPNHCPTQEARDQAVQAKSELEKAANVATIGFGVGLVGLATGLYLLLTAPSPKPPNSVRILPVLARGAAGVTIGAGF